MRVSCPHAIQAKRARLGCRVGCAVLRAGEQSTRSSGVAGRCIAASQNHSNTAVDKERTAKVPI